MSRTRYQRFSKWVKDKSKSTPAQWIASIATGSSLASGVNYCIALINSRIESDDIKFGVNIANYALTASVFIAVMTMTRHEIYKSIDSSHRLGPKIKKLKEELETETTNLRNTYTQLSSLAKIMHKLAINNNLDGETMQRSYEINFMLDRETRALTIHEEQREEKSGDIRLEVITGPENNRPDRAPRAIL